MCTAGVYGGKVKSKMPSPFCSCFCFAGRRGELVDTNNRSVLGDHTKQRRMVSHLLKQMGSEENKTDSHNRICHVEKFSSHLFPNPP